MPFVSRTRATLRRAEFGFFGVVVYTRVQTPRFCGAPRRAGVLILVTGVLRPLRTSWFTVGNVRFLLFLKGPSRRNKRPAWAVPKPNPGAMVAAWQPASPTLRGHLKPSRPGDCTRSESPSIVLYAAP